MVEDKVVVKRKDQVNIHHHFSTMQSSESETLRMVYDNATEDLVVKRISDSEYEIQCVPVLGHDLNLHDRIVRNAGETKVISVSGQTGFRVALEEGNLLSASIFYLELGELTRGVFIEPISHELICLSVDKNKASKLANLLQDMEKRDIIVDFETVNS